MTADIALVLLILLVSLVLFISEKIRMDVVSLMVLAALALTRLVTPEEALSGFSNAAVVTVWAMFILSEGLTNTGVANIIGRQVLRLAGDTERRMIFVIMLSSGVLSAVMNNIGVAALMLPVVINISRKVGVPASRLLMPLAYGSLLGGLTTLIGTPPNLLVANALRENGLEPFRLFDFTPIGGIVMIVGIAFVSVSARYILPSKDPAGSEAVLPDSKSLQNEYNLGERTFVLKVQPDSPIGGMTLKESRLGRALGLFVVALQRNGQTIISPGPNTILEENDRLLTQGRTNQLNELRGWHDLMPRRVEGQSTSLAGGDISMAHVTVANDAAILEKTIRQIEFRKKFGLNLLIVRRGKTILDSEVGDIILRAGDRLVLRGMKNKLEDAGNSPEFRDFRAATPEELERFAHIETRLFEVRIPEKSWLAGKRISESRLRGGFDLHIIKIARAGVDTLLPDPEETLQGGDILTLHGRKEDLDALKGLQQLDIHVPSEAETRVFESEEVGLLEATLAPRSKLAGRTPAQIEFRAKYGSQLLGILRADRAYRSNLGNMPLEFGDALLIMGPRERLRLLNSDPDFLLLTQFEPKTYKREKAILAAAIMLAVLIPVFLGWFPIAITAITGATLMILLGCLTMEEAYRAIEWKAVFLIAGMLPLGIAMQHSGAAAYLADGVMVTIGGYGPWTVIFGLYFATALATTIIPTAALVVLMAPIVIKACNDMGVSPHAGMMAVAMAASASFTSPISHPANVLVMGPGGYRFIDYIKLGAPLALVVFITVVIVLPIFWPL